MESNCYKIIKVLNNNVLLAYHSDSKEEMVLVGKGIGFGRSENTVTAISSDKIEKAYHAYDSKTREHYISLIQQLDRDVLGISAEIISNAENLLGPLNQHIHVALTDHIGFAMERIKMGIEINNPFLFEIKTLYPEEYRTGEIAAKMLHQALGVEINSAEIGFLTLHFHSARQNRKVSETVKSTRILKELVGIIHESLPYPLAADSLMYARLITHLKTVLNRLEEHKYIQNILLDTIKEKFPASFAIAEKLGRFIEESLQEKVTEDELGFMALHIERIRDAHKKII